jgi:myo-inositol 2-dehydrogenase/D-chiro-inositol 1-dehydrogenase
MNVLVLGDGEEELAWARWLLGRPDHRLDAVYPGFADASMAGIPTPRDLEDALVRPGLDAVIVGGPLEARGESLRRAAAEGFAIICLHPPGPDSEAYYQVALSREETGAAIVPDLPMRLHPGVRALRLALADAETGSFRGLRLEATPSSPGTSLVRVEFARAADAVRAIVGEIDALTATGAPPGDDPDLELVVHLRSTDARGAEVRIGSGTSGPTRLTLLGSLASLTLEIAPGHPQQARLLRHEGGRAAEHIELPSWDPHAAIFAVLAASMVRREAGETPSPSLLDGTRAMELAEAVSRSLRRGRTIELHYESISEESTFKSVMTSTGCMVFLASFAVLLLSMAGAAVGMKWMLYIPYIIPPALVLFVVLQTFRLAIRRPSGGTASMSGVRPVPAVSTAPESVPPGGDERPS